MQHSPIPHKKSELDLKLDKLTELWRALEWKLLSMRSPRKIARQYDLDGDFVRFLGVQRYGGEWRLCHSYSQKVGEDKIEHHWRPILDCAWETRCEAVVGIARLEEDIKETSTIVIPKIEEAIKALEKHMA